MPPAATAAAASPLRCLTVPSALCWPCAAHVLSQNPATRAQAEAALLDFRRTAGVEACVAILQQSADEAVQFQVGWLVAVPALVGSSVTSPTSMWTL